MNENMNESIKIVHLFLEKLEKLSETERSELLKVITFLNRPIISGSPIEPTILTP